jgi:hypothetical protein
LKGLEPGVGYDILLAAFNKKGRSAPVNLQGYTLKNPEKQTGNFPIKISGMMKCANLAKKSSYFPFFRLFAGLLADPPAIETFPRHTIRNRRSFSINYISNYSGCEIAEFAAIESRVYESDEQRIECNHFAVTAEWDTVAGDEWKCR